MSFKVIWTGKEPRTALADKIKLLEHKLSKHNEYVIELLDEITKLEHKIRDRDQEIYQIAKSKY